MKIKVKDITAEDLERIKQVQINKCKSFLANRPFTTNLYMSIKTGVALDFIVKHKKEIYGL